MRRTPSPALLAGSLALVAFGFVVPAAHAQGTVRPTPGYYYYPAPAAVAPTPGYYYYPAPSTLRPLPAAGPTSAARGPAPVSYYYYPAPAVPDPSPPRSFLNYRRASRPAPRASTYDDENPYKS